jgi:hypothetical protein
MLLKYHSRYECGFHAMSLLSTQDLPERALRLSILFPIVRNSTQVTLHLIRCAMCLDQFPLVRCECGSRGSVTHRESNSRTVRDNATGNGSQFEERIALILFEVYTGYE